MPHTKATRYSGYDNSKKQAFNNLMDNPALGYKAKKYEVLLSDLQAGILKHPKRNCIKYLFVTFSDHLEARKWIVSFTPKITPAIDQLNELSKSFKQEKSKAIADPIITFSLTNNGYDFLGLPESIKPNDEAFLGNLNERLKFSKEKTKDFFKQNENIHAIIMIANDSEITEKFISAQLTAPKDLITYFEQSGSNKVEPFGKSNFEDGIANPKFFPTAYSNDASNSNLSINDLPPLKLALVVDRGGNTDAPAGSLGAFARFEFNKTAINSLVKQIKDKTNAPNNDLPEALIVGRFNDGTPLTLSDQKTNTPTNDFNYKEVMNSVDNNEPLDDQQGSRCPFHTHARKSNPRIAGSENKKIVRRGVYYSENAKTQGLLFVAYQNSLIEQFEYMVNHWIMNPLIETGGEYKAGNFKDYQVEENEKTQHIYKHSGVDMIFAKKGSHYSIPTQWNHSDPKMANIEIENELVDFEGGIYFFTPSISFLKKITVFPDNLLSQQNGLIQAAFDIKKEKAMSKTNFNFGSIMNFIPKKEESEKSKKELDKLYIKNWTRLVKKDKA